MTEDIYRPFAISFWGWYADGKKFRVLKIPATIPLVIVLILPARVRQWVVFRVWDERTLEISRNLSLFGRFTRP